MRERWTLRLAIVFCCSPGQLYEYAVEAKDSEGYAVVFELETGPTGMFIDKESGRVVWKVWSPLKGAHHVKIVAADAKGVRSWQEATPTNYT